VRAELDHAFKLQTLQHEAALAQVSDVEANRRWQDELKKECEAADHRRTQELQELDHVRTKVRSTRLKSSHSGWASAKSLGMSTKSGCSRSTCSAAS